MSPMLVLHKRRGQGSAWRGNLVLLAAMLLRMPFWLPLDLFHLLRGSAQRGLVSSRFAVLAAHLKGIVRPVWLPASQYSTQIKVEKAGG